MRARWRIATLSLVAAGLAAMIACGVDRPSASDNGGDGSGAFAPGGPCAPEGATRDCHVKTGEVADVVHCIGGVQECRGGMWSTCGGKDITLSSFDRSALRGSGLRPAAIPVGYAGLCLLDPCDPNCLAYNEPDAATADAGPPEYVFNSTDIFGGAPGGFAKKSDCGSDSDGCNNLPPGAAYTRKCGGEDHFSIWDSCLADTHCDVSENLVAIQTTAVATHNGNFGSGAAPYGAPTANNGVVETAVNCGSAFAWISNTVPAPEGKWLQLAWATPQTIVSMKVDTILNTSTCGGAGRTLGSATIQWWDSAAGAWVTDGSVADKLDDWTYKFTRPVFTDKIRLYDVFVPPSAGGQLNNPLVYEWIVYGGKGACRPNWDTSATSDAKWDEAGQHWTPAVCAGADLTVSAACEIAGVAGFNICNRGSAPAVAANVGLYIDNGAAEFGVHSSGTCPSKAPSCSPAIPGGTLGAGKCFRVTNAQCPAWTGGGNPVAYVNPQALIAECGGLLTAGAATGPGCNNNWADVKNKSALCGTAGDTFVVTSRTFTYSAACLPGYGVRWKALAYEVIAPCNPGACDGTNGTKVEFFGTLTDILVDGGLSAPQAEKIMSDATTTQTVNCTYGTDAGGQPICPVDLATWGDSVTAQGSTYEKLDLRIQLTPTPNKLAAPSVVKWAVSYDCVANE